MSVLVAEAKDGSVNSNSWDIADPGLADSSVSHDPLV